MGCGSSTKGGNTEFKPKEGRKCLAACNLNNGKMTTAYIIGQDKEDKTWSVYFPQFEPQLTTLPKGSSPEDIKAFKEEKVKAIKNMVPGLGKKESKQEKIPGDKLQKNPFPTKIGKKSFSEVGLPKLDDIFNPAGALLATLTTMNDLIFTCWDKLFNLEDKYDLPFPTLLKCMAKEIPNPFDGLESLFDSMDGFRKDVGVAILFMAKSAMDSLKTIPKLLEEITELATKGKQATEEEGKTTKEVLQEMAADLDPMAKLKALKNAGMNLKTLADMPKIATKLKETIEFTVNLFKGVFDKDEEA